MNTSERPYDASDIRELMSKTGAWARNWDDVLNYLDGIAEENRGETRKNVPQLIEDVRHLRNDNVHFTTDYQEVWEELTGEGRDSLSAGGRNNAEKKHASSRVLDILQRVESREYREMAGLLDSPRKATWDRK